ncbi:MAG: hypothetical protein GF418_12500 [Chitinivibrionales bacterium]|nr:hypothetical protein [Chitinivibrionales bacterium]MBD3396439.1 hypothetical protein [Chitinivibrionales bacterium]
MIDTLRAFASRILILQGMLLILALPAVATEQKDAFDISGGFSYHALKVVHSTSSPSLEIVDTTYLIGAWLQSFSGNLSLEKTLANRLEINVALSGGLYYATQDLVTVYFVEDQGRRTSTGLRGSINYIVGDLDRPIMEVKGGYFDFDYTKDLKNLGGYLLRSDMYPGVVYSGGGGSGFFGLGFHSDYIPRLSHDLIVNMEMYYPIGDISFAYVADVDIGDFLNVGAGAVLYRLIQPGDNKDLTSPTTDFGLDEDGERVYYTKAGTKVMGRFSFDPKPLLPPTDFFAEDDLRLYAEAAILGVKNYPTSTKSDGDGTYEVGFDDITERVPVMAGINVPVHPLVANTFVPAGLALFLIAIEPDEAQDNTFRVANDEFDSTAYSSHDEFRWEQETDSVMVVTTDFVPQGFDVKPARPFIWAGASLVTGIGTYLLEKLVEARLRFDVVSIEVEYYGSPYRNVRFRQPAVKPMEKGDKDDWKWSVYAKKSFADDRLAFSLLVACDQTRALDAGGFFTNDLQIIGSNEWYWSLGFDFSF